MYVRTIIIWWSTVIIEITSAIVEQFLWIWKKCIHMYMYFSPYTEVARLEGFADLPANAGSFQYRVGTAQSPPSQIHQWMCRTCWGEVVRVGTGEIVRVGTNEVMKVWGCGCDCVCDSGNAVKVGYGAYAVVCVCTHVPELHNFYHIFRIFCSRFFS